MSGTSSQSNRSSTPQSFGEKSSGRKIKSQTKTQLYKSGKYNKKSNNDTILEMIEEDSEIRPTTSQPVYQRGGRRAARGIQKVESDDLEEESDLILSDGQSDITQIFPSKQRNSRLSKKKREIAQENVDYYERQNNRRAPVIPSQFDK